MLKTSIVLFVLSFSVLHAVSVSDRDSNTSHDIIFGSKPSDLPSGGLLHDFKPINKDFFSNADVSGNPEARIFAGYGVYDKEGENCMQVDAVTSDGSLADSKFKEFKIFNGHAYGISLQETTYQQCQTMALKYNGYPVEITTLEEDGALKVYYNGYDYWIGTQRAGACPSDYVIHDGTKARYDGYFDDAKVCNDPTPYTSVKKSLWTQRDGSHMATCMIEFDTNDWKKPIKSCAPWWGIERAYPADKRSKYIAYSKTVDGVLTEFDIRDFVQKDFPKRVKVCSEVNETSTASTSATVYLGNHTVTCNSYYDRTASPICEVSPSQDVCKVDECRGAIKNRCQLIESGPAPLSYSKESAFKNGVYVEVKKRTDIQIHRYSCPIATKGEGCKETKIVTMLPVPCPGTDVDENGTETRSIRVYGSPSLDGPNKYVNGKLNVLYGKCPSGDLVEVPFDEISQNIKTCKEYFTETSEEEWDELCQVNKSSSDYVVQAGVGAPDAYKYNDSCIRINNIKEARPQQDIRVDYSTKGFGSLSIVKALVGGDEEVKYQSILSSKYYQSVLSSLGDEEQTFNATGNAETFFEGDVEANAALPSYSCDGLGEQGPSNAMFSELMKLQEHGVKKVYDTAVGELFLFGEHNSSECIDRNSKFGTSVLWGSDDKNETDALSIEYEAEYQLTSIGGLSASNLVNQDDNASIFCVGFRASNNIEGDVYSRLDINGFGTQATNGTIDTLLYGDKLVNYERCREIAICTGTDVLNTSKYSGEEQCRLHLGEGTGESAYNEFKSDYNKAVDAYMEEKVGVDSTSSLLEQEIQARSITGVVSTDQIDGYVDIYAIMEFNEQSFGYITSWNFRNFESSLVKVNNKVISPILEHTLVNNSVLEDWYWDYDTYRNYEPDAEAIAYGGLSGGAAAVTGAAVAVALGDSAMTLALVYSAAGGPIGIGIAIVVGGVIALITMPTNLKSFSGENRAEIFNVRDAKYRYMENPYGYEGRTLYEKNGQKRVMYGKWKYGIASKMESGDAYKHFKALQTVKKEFYKDLNIPINNFIFPNHEKGVPMPYPDGEKWNPWAKKHDHAVGSGTLDFENYHNRLVNSVYMGATNTVTIVVPYKGDYQMEAYNANNEQVSSYLVSETAFIGGTSPYGQMMLYSQVKFGENMSISPRVIGNSCKEDLMVDVGGGVSGAYYALGVTDRYSEFECGASDPLFIEENKITKIVIRPIDQEDSFTIELPKPLVYANRVFCTTMGESEDRLYRCYDTQYPTCSSYQKVDEDE